MASKKIALKFNKVVNNFLNDLSSILPKEKDILVFQSQISVMEMVDPSKMIKSFIKFAFPFKDKIVNKDEKFFLGEGNVPIEADYMSESIHLKKLWENKLSDENKEIVWKYFQVLTVLAEKYAD